MGVLCYIALVSPNTTVSWHEEQVFLISCQRRGNTLLLLSARVLHPLTQILYLVSRKEYCRDF